MHRHFLFSLFTCLCITSSILMGSAASEEQAGPVKGMTFYVRQTVGDDANDGLSPKTAWQHISKLSKAMHAGDTAYVGPGLYREEIDVLNSGTAESRLTFVADITGQNTGDPQGVVMITGAEPVDENIFEPLDAAGIYKAKFTAYNILGVVEMDGPQYRYQKVTETIGYLKDKMRELDIVTKLPSSYFYDEAARVLYIHTSDGKHPSTHEIELLRRLNGISIVGKHHITVMGFTFRHMGDAGINFNVGSGDGIALNNISYGSRQGIRMYNATNIVLYGNTLFRNENSGVYFGNKSTNGAAIGNIAYENSKGIRFGWSLNGFAIDNMAFDNDEIGISVEEANYSVLRNNRLINNKRSQLRVFEAEYDSEANCFEKGRQEQFIADFLIPGSERKTLADYQKAKQQDMHSREGNCGKLPEKIDVRKLDEETKTYAERARKILGGSQTKSGEGKNLIEK